jgi:hypothetical protein
LIVSEDDGLDRPVSQASATRGRIQNADKSADYPAAYDLASVLPFIFLEYPRAFLALDPIPVDPHALRRADRLMAERASVIDKRFGFF